ncbi:phosphoglycolate phosphatase [Celeribacter neptunius]|uniref:phosphoglycolate phosphatase n=1 Tax=Celeribacter neptunius TaxID=588602 RepID=A0A1I3PMB1_9RHOB|nr:phosphoglycolate phosphatase [Celeribacter neptunius]SFJ22642.1 phosphoglycolate phosphatase [Celeribacter neptunius]
MPTQMPSQMSSQMTRILFDLDGTLIDSAPDIHAMANTLLAREDKDPISLDEARGFVGNGAKVFVTRMCAARSIKTSEEPRLHKDFLALYETAVELTVPYPGAIEALTALKAAGHRLGVATNKPESPARAVLEHLNMTSFFEVILGGDSCATHKPDPLMLHEGFKRLGDGPALFVGDSEIDAAAAKNANTPFLLYTEGYRKAPAESLGAAAIFSDFATLPEHVTQILESTG